MKYMPQNVKNDAVTKIIHTTNSNSSKP